MQAQAIKNKEINEAYGVLKELSKDEALQMLEFYEERARKDAMAREDYHFGRGEEKGRKEGEREGILEGGSKAIAKFTKYLKEGNSPEEAERLVKLELGLK